MAQRFGIGPRRLDRAGRGDVIELVEHFAGGKPGPLGRLHPRHPAAFLIDGDEQPVAPVDFTQSVGKRAQLLAVFDIAAKDDITRRIGVAKESALIGSQGQSGKAKNRRRHCAEIAGTQRFRKRAFLQPCGKAYLTWQASPEAFSLPQSACAAPASPGSACRRKTVPISALPSTA